MMDWSDLRYFVAVARHGSTLAAGRALSVSQSTVQRRVAELERALQRKLVTRDTAGYGLTNFGQQLLPYAERVEEAVLAFESQSSVLGRSASSTIRLTCPEPIMYRLTQRGFLDRFHARYPDLRVEFVMSDKYLDIAKGDADVALRSGDTDDGVLVGKKIADSLWAIYASVRYVEDHGKPQTLAGLTSHPVVAFDASMKNHRLMQWLNSTVPQAEIVARVDSVLGLVTAAKSGLGLVPLPTALGDAESELIQVVEPVEALKRSWRLLTHPDLRLQPHIATFFDFVDHERNHLKEILTG